MNRQILPVILALLIAAALLAPVAGIAQDRMTYEQFQSQLQAYQAREQTARDAIAVERKAIDELRAQIADMKAQIAAVWDEIFAALGITREEYEAFLAAIQDLDNRVGELARLTPDKLLERAKELDALAAETQQMLANKIAKLSEPRTNLNRIAARIEGLKKSLPKPQHDMYSVLRGDYLWKIAGKPAIFGDPWKWMRIYSANRDEIRNPDLIYPDQRLRIPRQIGRDEHLVTRGEFLAKIAGYPEVYGDPFQWTKIYQANKGNGFIQDPNRIYPEMILTISRD